VGDDVYPAVVRLLSCRPRPVFSKTLFSAARRWYVSRRVYRDPRVRRLLTFDGQQANDLHRSHAGVQMYPTKCLGRISRDDRRAQRIRVRYDGAFGSRNCRRSKSSARNVRSISFTCPKPIWFSPIVKFVAGKSAVVGSLDPSVHTLRRRCSRSFLPRGSTVRRLISTTTIDARIKTLVKGIHGRLGGAFVGFAFSAVHSGPVLYVVRQSRITLSVRSNIDTRSFQ